MIKESVMFCLVDKRKLTKYLVPYSTSAKAFVAGFLLAGFLLASRKTSQPENIFKSCVRLMSVAKYCAGLCYIKMNEGAIFWERLFSL